ncbi:hypothetical protein J132_07931 [Termitomyces sp. J132]|nr:hypothetical protein J132_07931 [Termitomyces sp. J132]
MAHLRCSTFNALNSYIPNLNRLTLASHNKSSRSPTLSPLRSYYDSPYLASRSHAGNDDFQSNAQLSFSRSGLQFPGLGIAYPQASEMSTTAGLQKPKIAPAEAIPAPCLLGQALKAELGEPSLGLQGELSCFYEPQVAQSWSFSSSVSSSESMIINSQTAKTQNTNLGSDAITFSSLATTSGMSITSLADHLSATADIALQYLTSNSSGIADSCTAGSEGSVLEELCDERSIPWSSISPMHESDTRPSHLVTCSLPWLEPSHGVDPLNITVGQLLEPEVAQDPVVSREFSCLDIPFHSLTGFFETHSNNLTEVGVTAETLIERPEGATRCEPFPPLSKLDDEDSDYRLSDSGSTNWSSSPFPSPCQKTRSGKRLSQFSNRFRTAKTKKPVSSKPTKRKQRIEVITEALAPIAIEAQETTLFDVNLGTPVFDAHRGVNIDELRSKAERYRLRNPGRIYDNNWLASFAGKLSDRGELINDYRCYVAGCTQINKRRDHILIHIGSHLDQRPYACSYWYVTSVLQP